MCELDMVKTSKQGSLEQTNQVATRRMKRSSRLIANRNIQNKHMECLGKLKLVAATKD